MYSRFIKETENEYLCSYYYIKYYFVWINLKNKTLKEYKNKNEISQNHGFVRIKKYNYISFWNKDMYLTEYIKKLDIFEDQKLENNITDFIAREFEIHKM